MNLYDTLPDSAATVFGAEAVGSYAYDVLTVDVPVGSWIPSLEIARDKLGCTYFDWLSAVDEPGVGFRICAHVVSLENHRVRRLLLRTTVPHSAPSLPSAVSIYAGAEWHERETFEMFGVTFTDHPHLVHLLLPENFEGHPLRKDFVLAARVAKAWPGAKEPGEAHDPDAPKRRQMLPPGVPDPNDWGPLKGQLPPAPTRPTRTPRTGAAPARTPREGAPPRRTRSVADGSATQPTPPATSADSEAPARPARRTRSVADGSASQSTPPVASADSESVADGSASQPTPPVTSADSEALESGAPDAAGAPEAPARRSRSVADGSASQATPPVASADSEALESGAPDAAGAPEAPARRSRSVADGSASQAAPSAGAESAEADAGAETPAPARRTRSAADGSAGQADPRGAERHARAAPRSADAPWHHAKPAFEEPEPAPPPKPAEPAKPAASGPAASGPAASGPATDPDPDPTPDTGGDA
ncbi:NADH-quinone oxidoreductase subunit C [Streptomyces sp. APSN-46.1]|uniref:NADH-quinone oxidoreductase subunit C n=1 Tax=Streptomyces sp. APSN-46.1 TaxID=2929049 RepID=UPI001FB4A175|nr:NADH-quinone oxidoreductase subunit C [Streptomyces sp. APSN-46.1]MCJ1679334.1 NADH-quinone oxidoreductase subunit C [Streptomyces sp. APSN-46.1]